MRPKQNDMCEVHASDIEMQGRVRGDASAASETLRYIVRLVQSGCWYTSG